MKGDVEILVMLVDSYIADLNSAISAISAERIVKGSLSIPEQVRLNELVNRLRYVEHQKDRALYIEAGFIDTEKSIR